MKSRKDARLRAWIALSIVPRLGPIGIQKLLDRYSPHQLFELSAIELTSLGLRDKQVRAFCHPDHQYIDRVLAYCQQQAIEIVTWDCDTYPPLLKQIADPPTLLFCKGNTALLCERQLAMVGSRQPSYQGKELAREFACELSKLGLVITSGLARGIDGESHQGALDFNAATIAVLGTGIDIAYPKRHQTLYTDIIGSGGLVISELFPGIGVYAHNFPRRNRIISGLSLGTFVVEATVDSGSLITADFACEHNREVFALPGSIHNPQSRGCHHLIQQGAKLVQCAADIIIELGNNSDIGLSQKCTQKSRDQSLCRDQLLASVDFEATAIDIVVERSKLPVEVVIARLIKMELRGLVKSIPGGYVKLRRD